MEPEYRRIRVTSADALYHCAQHGKDIVCPSVSYLEEPTKAKSFLNLSMKAVFKCLEKGVYLADGETNESEHPQLVECDAKGVLLKRDDGPEGKSILEHVQQRMKSSGESQAVMAAKAGVTQQRVSEFFQKKSLRSHLERFARIYAPEIYEQIAEQD